MNLRDLVEKMTAQQRRELAKRAGVKPDYVYQLAKGYRRNPPVQTLIALVDADKRLRMAHVIEQFREAPNAPAADPPTEGATDAP